MAATLSGPIVLENPHSVDGSSRTVEFDGQMWLSQGNVLTGKFRYFNSSDTVFNDIGYYFAWIHVARVVVGVYRDGANIPVPAADDDAGGHGSGSETVAEDFHLYGDIVQLIQITPGPETMRNPPYGTFSGAAFNCNRTESIFDVNAAQYISYYKTQRNLSIMPIRAHFDEVRYKNKKPMPSNTTYVAVEGFITRIDIDENTGQPSLFHVSIDNINFLGKAVLPSGNVGGNQGSPSTPRSSRFRYNFDAGTTTLPRASAPTSPRASAPTSPSPGYTIPLAQPETSTKRQPKRRAV